MENLTIEEFTNLREAMYTCRHTNLSTNPSAFQAKAFFSNDKTFENLIEKLRNYLVNKPVETTNEQSVETTDKAKYLIDKLIDGWGLCPDIKIEKEDIISFLQVNL